MPPEFRWRGFQVAKAGNATSECEDAFAASARAGRFAVADGASESAFAGEWARLLTASFVERRGPWTAWLPECRQRWRTELEGRPMPWFLEEKFEDGAYATLLGLALDRGPRRLWHARAVGDSCLFHLRGDRLLLAFPFQEPSQFSNRPQLLRSRPSARGRQPRRQARGRWAVGDLFLMVTDALAEWLCRQPQCWRELARLATDAEFADWTAAARVAGMKNDDVTLLTIRCDSPAT